jgi:glycosyltransferase involved in cell wall biosynthesis
MDDFGGFEQPAHRRRLLVEWERELVGRVDLITVTARRLQARFAAAHPRVELLPNAVPAEFVDAMASAPVPADFAALPTPRLLFIGTLAHWIDVEALLGLADDRPDWSLVLIGPVEVDTAALAGRPNVHLLGLRPHAALPGYLAHAEALLMPFRVSDFTHAVNPVKLYEYLAAGPPIVSSPLAEVAPFADRLELTAPGERLAAAVARAMAEGPDPRRPVARRDAALANTWAVRADALHRLLLACTATDGAARV